MSKAEILNSILNNKPVPVDLPAPRKILIEGNKDLIKAFSDKATGAGSKVENLDNLDKVDVWIKQQEENGKSVFDFLQHLEGKESFSPLVDDPDKVDMVVIRGQLGVAENGAVWIDEHDMQIRKLPFLTSHLVLVLEKAKILPDLHEAYKQVDLERSGFGVFIAGPSKTADIEQAAKKIVQGASMDNNIICVLEKEVFVVESVADQLIAAFERHNAVVLKSHEIEQLEKIIFKETRGQRKQGVINPDYIGKNIQDILMKIGKRVEDNIRLAIAPVDVGHPLIWTEQMLPVLPVARVQNVDQAIDIAKEAEHGYRHTAMMYSKNLDNLSRMARVMNCSIFVKNGPSYAGLGHGGEGYTSFTIASPTGEGLTNPRSFTRERRCVLVDHFRII